MANIASPAQLLSDLQLAEQGLGLTASTKPKTVPKKKVTKKKKSPAKKKTTPVKKKSLVKKKAVKKTKLPWH
jgi:hypothetical protein